MKMFFRFFKNLFFNDWKLKLLSAAIALLLWYLAIQ